MEIDIKHHSEGSGKDQLVYCCLCCQRMSFLVNGYVKPGLLLTPSFLDPETAKIFKSEHNNRCHFGEAGEEDFYTIFRSDGIKETYPSEIVLSTPV